MVSPRECTTTSHGPTINTNQHGNHSTSYLTWPSATDEIALPLCGALAAPPRRACRAFEETAEDWQSE